MAPKKSVNPTAAAASTTTTTTPPPAAPAVTTGPTTATAPAVSTPSTKPTGSAAAAAQQNWGQIAGSLVDHYQKNTPQRTKLLDAFMAFLVVVGGLQALYCLVFGDYPFNAFLSGFSAAVGQFVLTASLRIQTTAANKADFPSVSPERAFADYVVGSLILQFFCINFIN